MNKLNKKGFTLIEMLVVIAIIAVLVSIIIPVVGNSTDKAKGAADAANLRSALAEIQIKVLDGDVATTNGFVAASSAEGLSDSLKKMESKYTEGAKLYYSVDPGDKSVDVMFSKSTTESEGHDLEYYQYIAENGEPENTTP